MKIMLRSSPAHHAAATHHHLNGHVASTNSSNHSSPASSSPILHHHHHQNGGASSGYDSPSIIPTTPTHTPTPTNSGQSSPRLSILDSCHRRIRLIGGGPVAFFGGLVAKARRKEREGGGDSGTAGQSGDPKLYLEATVLERKLPDADLRLLVDLPPGLDYNEWLASHTMALFDHVNLVYGTVSEFCTMSGCPDMTGPGQRTYLWFDEKGKKTRVAAPQYIDYVMTFIQKTVSDESIFPTKYANEFPVSFESIVRKIIRLLFHVVAHLYAAHFREVVLLGLHAHLNLTFAHLTALQHRFSLIEPKETEVLRDLELALRLSEDSNNTTTASTTTAAGVTSTNTTTSSSITPTNSSNISNSGCQQDQMILPPSTELATEATASMDLETSINNSSNNSQPMSQSIITQPPESIINIAPRINNNTEQPELTHA